MQKLKLSGGGWGAQDLDDSQFSFYVVINIIFF